MCAVLIIAGQCDPWHLLLIHSGGTMHMENLEVVTYCAIGV
jgi:hypothetical protein